MGATIKNWKTPVKFYSGIVVMALQAATTLATLFNANIHLPDVFWYYPYHFIVGGWVVSSLALAVVWARQGERSIKARHKARVIAISCFSLISLLSGLAINNLYLRTEKARRPQTIRIPLMFISSARAESRGVKELQTSIALVKDECSFEERTLSDGTLEIIPDQQVLARLNGKYGTEKYDPENFRNIVDWFKKRCKVTDRRDYLKQFGKTDLNLIELVKELPGLINDLIPTSGEYAGLERTQKTILLHFLRYYVGLRVPVVNITVNNLTQKPIYITKLEYDVSSTGHRRGAVNSSPIKRYDLPVVFNLECSSGIQSLNLGGGQGEIRIPDENAVSFEVAFRPASGCTGYPFWRGKLLAKTSIGDVVISQLNLSANP